MDHERTIYPTPPMPTHHKYSRVTCIDDLNGSIKFYGFLEVLLSNVLRFIFEYISSQVTTHSPHISPSVHPHPRCPAPAEPRKFTLIALYHRRQKLWKIGSTVSSHRSERAMMVSNLLILNLCLCRNEKSLDHIARSVLYNLNYLKIIQN